MKTIAIDVPEADTPLLNALLARLGLKSRVLTSTEAEDHATAKWIMEGADTEEVTKDEVMNTLRTRGA